LIRKLINDWEKQNFLRLIVADIIHCHLQLSLKEFSRVDKPMFGFSKTIGTAGGYGFSANVSHFHSVTS